MNRKDFLRKVEEVLGDSATIADDFASRALDIINNAPEEVEQFYTFQELTTAAQRAAKHYECKRAADGAEAAIQRTVDARFPNLHIDVSAKLDDKDFIYLTLMGASHDVNELIPVMVEEGMTEQQRQSLLALSDRVSFTFGVPAPVRSPDTEVFLLGQFTETERHTVKDLLHKYFVYPLRERLSSQLAVSYNKFIDDEVARRDRRRYKKDGLIAY